MPGLEISQIADGDAENRLSCDVLVIGGGPAGLTVARGLEGSGLDVLVLESGQLEETPDADALNHVIVDSSTWTEAQARRRTKYHAPQTKFWCHERQGYGVRCRTLGGSTVAWAGKSAAFDGIDYARRDWVPGSGWPIDHHDLGPHLDRAAASLNLGANCYDDRLWTLMQRRPPEPRPDPAVLGSFFWQFSRSTIRPMEVMHVGREFVHAPARGCRIMTDATAIEIITDDTGKMATGVRGASRSGKPFIAKARTVVLAASAIENARILLNSRTHDRNGLANSYDTVGRFLMDHAGTVVAGFESQDIDRMAQLFGFYGLKTHGAVNMYMRGIAPSEAVQQAEGLLNCAAYMPGERAPDNPWDALKRILKRRSESYLSDGMTVARSPGLIVRGMARLALQNPRFPQGLSRFIVNQVIRFRPNMAVEEFLTGGVPHKLVRLPIEVICEQAPDPENRVTLSSQVDRFGVPYPEVRWKLGELERRTIMRFAELICLEFEKAGLPVPVLEDWVRQNDFEKASIIDTAHTAGTTRMSDDPRNGVVDRNCKVHGIEGLYVAGASVFPTSGHANPTLMIVALAFRLADHLRHRSAT